VFCSWRGQLSTAGGVVVLVRKKYRSPELEIVSFSSPMLGDLNYRNSSGDLT
jgi:hypothetical protein